MSAALWMDAPFSSVLTALFCRLIWLAGDANCLSFSIRRRHAMCKQHDPELFSRDDSVGAEGRSQFHNQLHSLCDGGPAIIDAGSTIDRPADTFFLRHF